MIESKNLIASFNELDSVAREIGYRVERTENGIAHINHVARYIQTTKEDSSEYHELFILAHEIGHAIQFLDNKFKKYSNNDEFNEYYLNEICNNHYRQVMYELDAWKRAYSLLIKRNIPTKGFIKIASFYLQGYISQTNMKEMKKKESWRLVVKTVINLIVIKLRLAKSNLR